MATTKVNFMDKEFSDLTSNEVKETFEQYLADYKLWVDKRIPIAEDWEEEINYISFVREDLGELVTEFKQRNINADTTVLDSIDNEWLAWIKSSNPDMYASRVVGQKSWWQAITQLS